MNPEQKRLSMKAVTLSVAKKDLRALIREVCANSEPAVIVDNESAEQAVLLSLEDYRSLEETAYLLRSPADRAHLEEALQQVNEGKTVEFPSENL
jgi:antitoxin YefM